MFGIRLGPKILRREWFGNIDYWFMSEDENLEPIVRESNIEIDKVLQEMSVEMSNYDLIVYELDDDEIAEITIKKLQGFY